MTDSLKVLFGNEFVKALSNDSSELNSTYITVIGVLLAAIITVVSQYFITTKMIRSDIHILLTQDEVLKKTKIVLRNK